MHAIEIAETGDPEVLDYVARPVAEPGPGQVLIKADAIGVNFIDTYFRTGRYPHPLPFIPGSEVCGTVAAVGERVHAIGLGDRAATSDAVGAYAEYSLAPADLVTRVPARRDHSGSGRLRAAEGPHRPPAHQVGLPGPPR